MRALILAEAAARRHTPPSVRFIGRRVYGGLVVVLVSAMIHGLKPERVCRLREALQIDRRTLDRGRQWWRPSANAWSLSVSSVPANLTEFLSSFAGSGFDPVGIRWHTETGVAAAHDPGVN